jgi:hypothetical protein
MGRNLMTKWVCLVAGTVAVRESQAQVTRLTMEVSEDNGNSWTSVVSPALGTTLYFRLRAELIGATALG